MKIDDVFVIQVQAEEEQGEPLDVLRALWLAQ